MPAEERATLRDAIRAPIAHAELPARAVRPAGLTGQTAAGLGWLLASGDPASRAALVGQVQRLAGNSSVQRLLDGHSVQRCTATTICPECAARGEGTGGPVSVQGDWLDTAREAGAAGLDFVSRPVREAMHLLSCSAPVRLLAVLGAFEAAAIDLLVGHIRSGTFPGPDDARTLVPVVERAVLQGMCNCLPDRIITAIALHVYLMGQPLAQAHLQHYLTGGGADFPENMTDLFARNPTIRNNVGAQIGEQSDGGRIRSGVLEGGGDLPGGGRLPGFPPITQADYDDQDWRNSIGNVDRLDWTLLSGPDAAGNATVRITLADPYAWHPQEARMSQCVHQAIDNMKAHGAKEYMARGTGDIALNIGTSFREGPNEGAR